MGRYLSKKNIFGIGIFIISMSIFTACGKREYVDETMGDWTEEKNTQQTQEKETTSVTEKIETEMSTTKNDDKKFVGYYEYPTEEGMKINELEKACHIEQEILDSMDTDQLAQAVIDYPLTFTVFLSSSSMDSYSDLLEDQCDAYRELLTRAGAKSVLQAKISELKNSDDKDALVKIENFQRIIESEQNLEIFLPRETSNNGFGRDFGNFVR